ncbi:6-bladed beta-propeller [Gemmatimonadota bacterium]
MDRSGSRCPSTLVIAVLSILIVSCGNPSGHRLERFETEGVRTVRTSGGPKYDTPLLELESDLLLGVDEGEPTWQMFTRTPSLLVAPDGRLVLVDTRAFNIFIVSRDGKLLHQLGGKGAGPGEFENILEAFWAEKGREFWLTDQFTNRITRFSIDGEYLGAINYSEIRATWYRFWHLGPRTFMTEGQESNFDETGSATMRYAVMNDQLEITRELFSLEGLTYFRMSEYGRSPVPWSSISHPDVTPGGQIVLVQPDFPRLTVYSSTAESLLHIERDWELDPVTQEEKQNHRQITRERYPDAAVGTIQYPDHKPPFRSVEVDTEGRIWLRMYETLREEGTDEEPGAFIGYPYEIYSPEGVWLGTHVNRRIIRAIENGYLYQTFLSDAGAPRLERLRIVPLVRELRSEDGG